MGLMRGNFWRFGNETVMKVRTDKPNLEALNSELEAEE
jgi:hypothetical protein